MSVSRENQASAQVPTFEATMAGPPAPAPVLLDSSEKPGDEIGPYRLVQPLGEGGMGSVWLAEQTHPVRRQVALKVIKPGMDSRRIIARFEAERQALALMDHPNIAKVLDAGTTPAGRPFFAMELVGQTSITKYCDDHQLGLADRLKLFVVVCQAIQHAHQKGIIHRDIKPTNVLISIQDGKPIPKVIDFGLAKALHSQLTDTTVVTEAGVTLGTPEYMSPEQAGATPYDVDTRSDIYSLGVLLYELLTGSPPFEIRKLRQARIDAVMRIIREEEPPKPSTRVTSATEDLADIAARRQTEPTKLSRLLRGELDWISMKALEKDRGRRYQTAIGLGTDVERYMNGEPVMAGPPSPAYRLRKWALRYRRYVAAATLVFLALIFGMIGTTWGLVRARTAEREARMAEKQAVDAESATRAVKDFLQKDLLEQANPRNNPRSQKVTVEDVVAIAAKKIEEKFKDDPRTEAEIRQTIGQVMNSLSQLDGAQAQLEKAAALFQAQLGADDPRTLDCRSDLAGALYSRSKYKEAQEIYEDLVSRLTNSLGANGEKTLGEMNNLAMTLKAQDQFERAEQLLKQIYETRKQSLGPNERATLASMNNLAEFYRDRKDYPKALELAEPGLQLRRQAFGVENPDTLTAMNNLANLYQDMRQYDKAEKLYVECLKLRTRRFGETARETLLCASNLGELYRKQAKYDLAQKHLEQVYRGQKETLGTEHRDTLSTGDKLGALYINLKQYDKARPLLEEVVATSRTTFPSSRVLLRNIGTLASCYMRMNLADLAEPLFIEASDLAPKIYGGPNNRSSFQSSFGLASFYLTNGKAAQAAPILADLLPRMQNVNGAADADTLICEEDLAKTYLSLKQPEKAEPLARDLLTRRQEEKPTNVLDVSNACGILGQALVRQKKYEEAEPLLVRSFETLAATADPKAAAAARNMLPDAAKRLATMYEEWGKSDRAAEWRAKAAEISAKPGAPPRN